MNILPFASNSEPEKQSEAGFYSWDLSSNIMFADAAVADLFGLNPLETKNGMPIERYFERVHVDDKAELARAVMVSIECDQPFQENYRVHRRDDSIVHIMDLGRVFREASGEPARYSGLVFPMPIEEHAENKLLWHVLCSYDLALTEERVDVADQLRKIILDLNRPA